MTSADVLDGTDQMQEVRPARAVEHDAMCGARASWRDGGQNERLSANSCKPAGVPIDVGELRGADVVVMKDRMSLTRNDAQPVAADEQLGLVASIRQEAGRSRLDRSDSQRPHLGKDPLRIELVTPLRHVAHAPRRGRKCDAQTTPIARRSAARNPLQSAAKHGPEINRMVNARLVRR